MQIEFSLNTLLVFILAILPGLPGNQIFFTLIGEDRKDDIWKKLIRFFFELGRRMINPSYPAPPVSDFCSNPGRPGITGRFKSELVEGFLRN